MNKIKSFLLLILVTATGLCAYAQSYTYHYVVKEQGYKEGEPVVEYFKPTECNDLIQFSFNRNSAEKPYFDGENIVFPAANDGGPKGSSININLTDFQGNYVIKNLEVIMANNTGTMVQRIITNDFKREESKEACADSYSWTNEKLRDFTLINNGPGAFSVKEVTVTVAPYEQADTCGLILPYFEDFENSVKLHGARLPNSCWNAYQNCENALPDVIGLTTGASYVYDGNAELDMRSTPGCWNMAVLPQVKDGDAVHDLILDFYAEANCIIGALEVGVLENPDKPESFVCIDTIKAETLLKTWYHVIVPCNKYKGTGKYIAIRNINSFGTIHIDNLSVNRISEKPAPYHVVSKNSDFKKITVDWKDVVQANSWEIELVKHGDAPGTGNVHPVSSHPAVLDVEANQNYDIYVKAVYGNGNSEVSEPDSIHTPSCAEADMCTYTITWISPDQFGSLNNMIRVYINGFLTEYVYMPVGYTKYEHEIKVCKGDELRLAFKRGTNYTKYTFFTITGPEDEVICTASNGIITGGNEYIGDAITFMSYETPFLKLISDCSDCMAPSKPTASSITTTTADISWTAKTDADAWVIEYGEPGFEEGQGTRVEMTTNPYTLTNLTPVTDYEAYIYSRCGEELSKRSSMFIFSTKSDCASPVSLVANVVSATFITLKWAAGNGETEWEVRYLAPGETEYTEPVKVNEPTITFENLMNESQYTFNVRALCSESSYSSWVKVTAKTTDCKRPTNLKITDISNNTATLSWIAVNSEKKWIVSYKDMEATQWTMKIVTENPCLLTDLKADTKYDVHVEAFCSEDVMSEPSSDASFTTRPDGIDDYSFNPIVLYPSNADNIINVYVNDSRVHATGIGMYDMQGRLLQTIDVQGDNTKISVSHLSAGMYLIRVQTDAGNFLRKFIKK